MDMPLPVLRLGIAQRQIIQAASRRWTYPTSFTIPDLVIAAWQDYPSRFGLWGYETQWPDSNRVLACVWGKKGLLGLGFLERTPDGRFRLSPNAREEGA